MTILDYPIRVDREAERIITHNGNVTLDFNGNEQLRREAMRFYGQAPEAFRCLLDFYKNYEMGTGPDSRMESILRDAGVLP